MSRTGILGVFALAILAGLTVALIVTGADYPAQAELPRFPDDLAELYSADPAPSSAERRTVVVMVFDGLAPALVEAVETPTLDRIAREGSWTDRMVPPFPTISLISGFTISSGCWPERHGIVSNRFLDPERGFYDHSKDQAWVIECEQLHEVAERQGVPTATLDWYGDVSSTRGKLARRVTLSRSWDEFPDDAGRARQVVELLELPAEQRPQLILAYFKGPDGSAHFQGMDAEKTKQAVAGVDRAVASVIDAIESNGLRERAAVIVTTDHGMLPITHIVNVEYILRARGIEARVIATGTTAFLYFDDPATVDAAVAKLSDHEAFDLIRPHQQPSWSHLGTGPRVGDLILSAKVGYAIEDRGQWPWYLRWLAWTGPEYLDTSRSLKATHGYPPDTPGVAGVLYAWGDGIRAGNRVDRIDAIDIHPTVTRLLDIAPGRPVDGQVATALLTP